MALRTKNVEEGNLLTRLLRGISSPGRPISLTGHVQGDYPPTTGAASGNSPSFFVFEAPGPWQNALEKFGLALELAGETGKEKEQGQEQPSSRQPDFKKELALIFLGLEFQEAFLNGSVIELRTIEKPGHWETALLARKALPRGRVYFAIYNTNGQKIAWQTVNL